MQAKILIILVSFVFAQVAYSEEYTLRVNSEGQAQNISFRAGHWT